MKKITVFILFSLLSLAFFSGCSKNNSDSKKEVTVYTYDSFISEWGPGPEIADLFEQKTGIKVNYVDCGDGAQIFSKAVSEKSAPQSDVLLGLDNNLVYKARKEGILISFKPQNSEVILEGLESALGNDWLLTPFDYSHFAIIFDSDSKYKMPSSLIDLCDKEYEGKIILMDPRTSTPGLGFAAWTYAVFGDGYKDYWRNLKNSILTMSPGWSSGYGLFTKGEAPLVSSYTTSPAYHVEYGEGDRFKAVIFEEGHVMQVEGAGITAGTKNETYAKMFIEFLISDEAQAAIPLTQWMFPVNKNVELPDSYKTASPIPAKTLDYDCSKLDSVVQNIMNIINE